MISRRGQYRSNSVPIIIVAVKDFKIWAHEGKEAMGNANKY